MAVFLLFWCGSVINFFVWWLAADHVVSRLAMGVMTLVVGFTMLLPAWLFFTAFRARRPRTDLEYGFGRVAMIVTKAPSEPWPLVQSTIEAMLGQDYDHPYAVWLADEAPSDDTLVWCAANGVMVSSRHGIADYHQPTWPRRTKSKEGNLAFFYDHWGYRDYDIVCQFDADHVPRPNYLRTILRAFADPAVGYAAAPSICSTKAQSSWTARGRLHKEASLHGLLQAGHNQGFAPTCIGSHYAVRTNALKDIGGVGPELAEDFSTSFLLAAHGWKGVFSIDAIAEGDGPMSFSDGMTQELQWSRSLTTVALRYSPGHWKNLTRTEQFRFGFAQVWYPLFAGHLLVSIFLAPLAVVTNQPWVSVTMLDFALRAAIPTLIIVGLMSWFRSHGWLRPTESPVVSWEAALFNLARWPWNLVGIAQAVIGAIRGKEYSFRVTPKTSDGLQPLPPLTVAPYGLLVAGQSAVVLGAGEGSQAFGYVLLTTSTSAIYAAVAVAVVALHIVESAPAKLIDRLRASLAATLVAAVSVGIAGAVVVKTVLLVVGETQLEPATDLIGIDVLLRPPALVYFVAIVWLGVFVARTRFSEEGEDSVEVEVPRLGAPAPAPAPPAPYQGHRRRQVARTTSDGWHRGRRSVSDHRLAH